jgi:phospholipase/lecithinase/hemolysin
MRFKTNKLLKLLGSIALACVPLSINAATFPYNNIIFFGDSLTDNGNMYSKTLKYVPKSPPYYVGRFSNGPTWAELVAKHYKDSNQVTSDNYGFGGSTAYFHNPVKGYIPYTLKMAINSYLTSYVWSDKSHTLYSIWIGGNDYFYGAKKVDDATTKVIDSIHGSIEKLINRGGKYFLLMNLPDLAQTPYGRASENQANITELVLEHNRKLAIMVEKLQQKHPSITIRLYDMYSDYVTLNKDPEVFNKKYNIKLTDLTESCWPGGYTIKNNKQRQHDALAQDIKDHWQQNASLRATDTARNVIDADQLADSILNAPALSSTFDVANQAKSGQQQCTNPDNHVFWDSVHPTRVVHDTFSKIMIEYIDQNFGG